MRYFILVFKSEGIVVLIADRRSILRATFFVVKVLTGRNSYPHSNPFMI
jgi:hypothetical protein